MVSKVGIICSGSSRGGCWSISEREADGLREGVVLLGGGRGVLPLSSSCWLLLRKQHVSSSRGEKEGKEVRDLLSSPPTTELAELEGGCCFLAAGRREVLRERAEVWDCWEIVRSRGGERFIVVVRCAVVLLNGDRRLSGRRRGGVALF